MQLYLTRKTTAEFVDGYIYTWLQLTYGTKLGSEHELQDDTPHFRRGVAPASPTYQDSQHYKKKPLKSINGFFSKE